jgi:predicted GTPase
LKKTPRQLRDALQGVRGKVDFIRNFLDRSSQDSTWGLSIECKTAAKALEDLLSTYKMPEDYKVAVVGRFKAGKSSFVNELLGQTLAGVNTDPETAAVTSFRYGESVTAKIKFLQKKDWENICKLFQENPQDVDAHRAKVWRGFAGRQKQSTDDQITYDLDALERSYVTEEGYSLTIAIDYSQKKPELDFRRKIKEFTSGGKPLHCLVESIEVTAPATLLEEGVLLIDTPGLDDTERFRVSLTEEAVKGVDAVLFLTKSGASYGQSEKEFLLTLLRKGTIKQLIFVITQVDQTYDQHVRQARDQDDDLQTLHERIDFERTRINGEIEKTLSELSQSDSPAMQRYKEQLGAVEVIFTSAANHRDWKAGAKIPYALFENDPGGMNSVRERLLTLLSTESRVAVMMEAMTKGAQLILSDVIQVISSRREAIRNIKNREESERKLSVFRDQFKKSCQEFTASTAVDLDLLKKSLAANDAYANKSIKSATLLAEVELSSFERDDVGRHWKSRRSRNWGYMQNVQNRVANKIFPEVQEMLDSLTKEYASYCNKFSAHLGKLSVSGDQISESLDMEAAVPLDIQGSLEAVMERISGEFDDLISSQETSIISLMDTFVSEEIEEEIERAKSAVSDIWGLGTTVKQSGEVKAFYAIVKNLLKQALETHLRQNYDEFLRYLDQQASLLPQKAISVAMAELTRAEESIRAAFDAAISGRKEHFEKISAQVDLELNGVLNYIEGAILVGELPSQTENSGQPIRDKKNLEEKEGSQFLGNSQLLELSDVKEMATNLVKRIELKDGEKGWSYQRLFPKNLINGASRVLLTDPYLGAHHQLRNLKELIAAMIDATVLRELTVITLPLEEGHAATDAVLTEIAKELFKENGVTLNVERVPGIHDRYLAADNGVLFKLGRGLDIFKPATGVAAHRQQSRKVRSCEIDVFSVP